MEWNKRKGLRRVDNVFSITEQWHVVSRYKKSIADINLQIHYQSDSINGGKNSKNGRIKRTKEQKNCKKLQMCMKREQKICRKYKQQMYAQREEKTGEDANNRFTRRENKRKGIKGYEPGNY